MAAHRDTAFREQQMLEIAKKAILGWCPVL